MPSFSDLLNSKVTAQKLTLAKAADAVGVSLPSMRSALSGSAKPNARSIGKYAKFLGMSVDQAIALTSSLKRGGGTKGKAGKKKAGKPGKRGRPPGKRGRPPGKRGRPPGKRGRPPGPAKSASVGAGKRVGNALKRIAASLAKAESYLAKVRKALV